MVKHLRLTGVLQAVPPQAVGQHILPSVHPEPQVKAQIPISPGFILGHLPVAVAVNNRKRLLKLVFNSELFAFKLQFQSSEQCL